MQTTSRREFMAVVLKGAGVLAAMPLYAYAADPCAIQHPFSPPNMDFPGQCPSCGMGRPMWTRTWITFENSAGASEVCSFHCLADVALKSGENPRNVQVTLFKDPSTMIPADKAHFVVGSKIKGTMSMTSEVALASRAEAEALAKACGGEVVPFARALEMAKAEVIKENQMIAQKRLKTGKIVEPVDQKDACTVCGMFPARYPQNKCQIQTKDGKVSHFCSTQCMFEFLGNTQKYAGADFKPHLIWVVDYPGGSWISARTAYYVVGTQQNGPMGKEAFAFDKMAEAKAFADQNGGKVLIFQGVTIDKIKA